MMKKSGWDSIKESYKNRCVICGKPEKKVGALEQVHIKEHARVRYLVLPMCANHHKMYMNDQLSNKELKKIDLIILSFEKSRYLKDKEKAFQVSSTKKVGVS